MTINGTDIQEICTGTVYQFKLTRADKAIEGDSLMTALVPIPGRETLWRTVTVDIYCKADGIDRDMIAEDISKILNLLEEPAEIVFDNTLDQFYGVLTKWAVSGLDKRRAQKLTLTLKGYLYRPFEYEAENEVEDGGFDVIFSDSKYISCYAEISDIDPVDSTTDCYIYGLTDTDPIIIPAARISGGVVIDPTTGDIKDGAGTRVTDVIVKSFPMLKPGSNLITCDNISSMRLVLEGRVLR